ncbi:YiiX/YebB-like N1pC/P60 family cysteine hydrolase [Fusobacterium varium]|jgi:uncharacterized protein YycO
MKFFLFIFLVFLNIGCSNIPTKAWKEIKEPEIFLNLSPGDIIIKEKEYNLLGIFGHAGIMMTERLIVDYPKLGAGISVMDINLWLEKERRFIILKFNDKDELFEKKLLKNLQEYISYDKKYKVFINKRNESGFYCSQFIWYIYYKTGLDTGKTIDIDSNGGIFVLPYDFIMSNKFYIN